MNRTFSCTGQSRPRSHFANHPLFGALSRTRTDTAFQPTGSKPATSTIPSQGRNVLFGAPPEIRTQTLRGLKPLASAVGLEGHCIWRRVKESNPCRLSPAAGGSSPVCTHCSHTPLNLKILEDRTWDFYPCRTNASFRVRPSRDPSRLCSVLLRSDLIIWQSM